ncbi:hypothetical protein [Shimia sp.]|uniref:hypothetical protein n=1 Tax=Shimia sp. TaxID=1954381 RepID=UPI003B8B1DD7
MMMQEINQQGGTLMMGADHVRPKDETGRELISVKGLLEWAFATECATLDYDEIGEVSGGHRPGVGMEYRIMQMGALGKEPGELVVPDTSVGRSYPHDDAELVATVLRNTVTFDLAIRVADLARGCRAPEWDLGPQHLRPRDWGKRNHHGKHGKTEVVREVAYLQRGRRRVRKDLWVPCEWTPSNGQIAAAHRGYLDWWGALLSVVAGLRGMELSRFVLNDRMPPMAPWQKNV